jgi:hypothetical protein
MTRRRFFLPLTQHIRAPHSGCHMRTPHVAVMYVHIHPSDGRNFFSTSSSVSSGVIGLIFLSVCF